MTRHFDTIIAHGNIADGLGGEPFAADVGIVDGIIVAVGKDLGTANEIIDAKGMLVTPGFVDVHTHYDGQVTWDSRVQPSSLHGVTTVVMGNCGVGFAPCRAEDRERLIKLMEGVEDIPGAVLNEGIPWTWETFPQFLDFLDQRSYDIDIATQIPHGPVRVYVMGDRGAKREPARADDIEKMSQIVTEGIAAGALGFSTTRSLAHRTKAGELAPTTTASEHELLAIARGMKRLDKGVIQFIDDFHAVDEHNVEEFSLLRRLVEASGRQLSVTVTQRPDAPERWRVLLDEVSRANADGLPIVAQVSNRPIGLLFGLELSAHPFYCCPSYVAISKLPLAERVEAMREPELRKRLLSEEWFDPDREPYLIAGETDEMFEFGTDCNYAPAREERLGDRAKAMGISSLELAYDLMLKDEGRTMLYRPLGNYAHFSMDVVSELIHSPHSIVALGDGGAHLGMICDASLATYMLTYWTRDRDSDRLSIGEAVRKVTWDPARSLGLCDRGQLAPGYRADINVIDYDRLRLKLPTPVADLPSGGTRLIQGAEGYVATIKNGITIYRNGEPTGAAPGRLIRGVQPSPENTLIRP